MDIRTCNMLAIYLLSCLQHVDGHYIFLAVVFQVNQIFNNVHIGIFRSCFSNVEYLCIDLVGLSMVRFCQIIFVHLALYYAFRNGARAITYG